MPEDIESVLPYHPATRLPIYKALDNGDYYIDIPSSRTAVLVRPSVKKGHLVWLAYSANQEKPIDKELQSRFFGLTGLKAEIKRLYELGKKLGTCGCGRSRIVKKEKKELYMACPMNCTESREKIK